MPTTLTIAQFFQILRARRAILLATIGTLLAAAVVISVIMPKRYTAETALVLDFKAQDPISGAMLPVQLLPGYMATQVDIITSHNVALKVVDRLGLAKQSKLVERFEQDTGGKGDIRAYLADWLLNGLKVEPSRSSSVIDLAYSGPEPQFSADVANAFAQAYVSTTLELKTEPAKETASWYNEQIKQLRTNLESAQARLSQFQQQKGVVLSDERLDVETARLNDLSTQLVMAQSAAFDFQARQSQAAAPEVVNNPLVQSLRGELARNEAKLAEMGRKMGPNHPEYQRAQAAVDSIRRDMNAAVGSIRGSMSSSANAAKQRENELRGALAEQKSRVLQMKQQRDEMSVLVREVENAQRIYDSALQRLGQTALEAKASQTEIAILNPAVPPTGASSPKWSLNLGVALFLGTLAGIGLALLRELSDRRVRSTKDMVEALGLPVLGNVTAFPKPAQRRLAFKAASA